ncbi:hypothetical protein WJX81_001847 [Elliptochloris bilobata]|uniref:shikimate dehydrogenase (NADP(+)) n=1 Tax=Elliptochloris bilobata TaxID=381761 RepID=A0AAW1SG60_9CHLO
MVDEIDEAAALQADIIELRLDFLQDLTEPERTLQSLFSACQAHGLPYIVTYRPNWEGGQYGGGEEERLMVLGLARDLGAPYVDMELKAAPAFTASHGGKAAPAGSRLILSHHDYDGTPDAETLQGILGRMTAAGADVPKIACVATDVADSARMLQLAADSPTPIIALSMGERGLPCRILAPKFGGVLTFGALSAGRESAPGQPTVQQLRQLFRLPQQRASTQVFGIVGKPVSHSRSPALHNAAFEAGGVDAVYVPLLTDDLPRMLAAFGPPAFPASGFNGFSVTIPHKVAALEAADEADEVAAKIGAANTLVRQPDGSLKAYNTDWSAALDAVEAGLGGGERPLAGKRVVVLGAGGTGRAIAFGAQQRGATVLIANRTRAAAEALAEALGEGASAMGLEELAGGGAAGDVLMNTTSVGMAPAADATPVPAAALAGFKLVFDAIYTPLETRLLREAKEAQCKTVSGVEMFVRQAAQQFELFTGQPAPLDVMRAAVLKSLGQR